MGLFLKAFLLLLFPPTTQYPVWFTSWLCLSGVTKRNPLTVLMDDNSKVLRKAAVLMTNAAVLVRAVVTWVFSAPFHQWSSKK